jgi:hypothetical protein
MERRLVGLSRGCSLSSTPPFGVEESCEVRVAGLARCWVLRERALVCFFWMPALTAVFSIRRVGGGWVLVVDRVFVCTARCFWVGGRGLSRDRP